MYTIAVGSVDERGKQAPFDENCPAKIAVTFSYNSKSSAQLVVKKINSDTKLVLIYYYFSLL